jgi:hypothetical protein
MLLFHIVFYLLVLLVVAVLHWTMSGVPLHPLYLLGGSLVGSYALTWIAGHASRGIATRKVVGRDDDGGPQPDPPRDLPPSKAWYIESAQPQSGLRQSCSFIEFDERGDYLDFRQHRHAYEKVRILAKENKHLIVVIFVHGWRNSAQSANVVSFNEFLHQLSTFSDANGIWHRVHGIYISWRGGCLRPVIEQDEVFRQVTGRFGGQPIVDLGKAAFCAPFTFALETFTYFDRKAVPEHLFGGTSLSRAIFSCAHATKRYRPDALTFLIGHSFGGLTLERTFQNATIGELSEAWPWGEPELIKSAETNPLPFDTVLLVNSAAPSIYAKQFQSYMAAHRQAMVRDRVKGANSPIFISLTSAGDQATGGIHPLANSLCFLLPTLRRKYYGSDFILEEKLENANVEIRQSYYYRHTPGHNPLLVNRFIEPDSAAEPIESAASSAESQTGKHLRANLRKDVADPLKFTTEARRGGKAHAWKINFPPETDVFNKFSNYEGRRPVTWTVGARGTYLRKESGYWIVRCPAEIIRDHNDIWSQQAMDTYAALYRLALVLRELDPKA